MFGISHGVNVGHKMSRPHSWRSKSVLLAMLLTMLASLAPHRSAAQSCPDIAPSDTYTCAEQASFDGDKCAKNWMQNHCCQTCFDCDPSCYAGVTVWNESPTESYYVTTSEVYLSPNGATACINTNNALYYVYGTVTAYNALTGEVQFTTSSDFDVQYEGIFSSDSSVLFLVADYDNSWYYFSDRGGVVWALNATDGSTLWMTEVSDATFQGPGLLTSDGSLWIVRELGDVFAFDTQTGQQVWNATLSLDDITPLVRSRDNRHCYATSGTSIVAIDTVGGNMEVGTTIDVLLTDEVLLDVVVEPIVDDSDATEWLVVCGSLGTVVKVSTTAWATLLVSSVGRPLESTGAISIDGSMLFIPSLNGSVVALNTSSGAIGWSFEQPGWGFNHAVLSRSGAQVFVGTSDGPSVSYSILYSLNTADGSTAWTFQVDSYFPAMDYAPAVSPDGRYVYVHQRTGGMDVYCLFTGEGFSNDTLPKATTAFPIESPTANSSTTTEAISNGSSAMCWHLMPIVILFLLAII